MNIKEMTVPQQVTSEFPYWAVAGWAGIMIAAIGVLAVTVLPNIMHRGGR